MTRLTSALRTLFKAPFVTTIAAVSLALGIGANTAIFALFNQMLLRPLPVQSPDKLVNLTAPSPKPVVLSHAYWVARFGADESVLNRSIIANGRPMTIVGVAPKGFSSTTLGSNPEIRCALTS